MKKFTKILFCLMLCVLTFGFAACKGNDDHPPKGAVAQGNGGFSVQVENYLYFVNGYFATADMKNKSDTYSVGALMVAELDDNGNLVVDENGCVTNARVLSSNLCGFEATNLFAYNGYLYFTTPCLENVAGKVDESDWAKERVVFNRMNLETEKVEKIYQSSVENSKLEYKYFLNGTKPYLMVFEKGANLDNSKKENVLYRVNIADKNKVDEVATNLTGVVFNTTANVEVSYSDECKNVFYSVEVKEDDETYYALYRYNVATNKATEFTTNDNEITVKFVSNKYVYATIKNSDNRDLYRANYTSDSSLKMLFTSSVYTNIYLTEDGESVVAVKDNQILMHQNGAANANVNKIMDGDATTLTVIDLVDGYVVFHDENNNLKVASYANLMGTTPAEIRTLISLEGIYTPKDGEDSLLAFDMDDEFVYFYKTVGSNKYLFRLKINNHTNQVEELVGVYNEADIPADEE